MSNTRALSSDLGRIPEEVWEDICNGECAFRPEAEEIVRERVQAMLEFCTDAEIVLWFGCMRIEMKRLGVKPSEIFHALEYLLE